jgi:putative resolvase
MKLSTYAKKHGVCYRTAYLWFKQGLIPGARQMSTGTILIDEEVKPAASETRIVTYSRVSNSARRSELKYQVSRVADFCAARGMVVSDEYSEVASGMNDSRKQLWLMIDSKPTVIVVENKDRLTRFGFEYLKRLLEKQGTQIVVMNESATDEQDLFRDLVSVITSFCSRLYGLRKGHNKAKQIIADVLNNDNL